MREINTEVAIMGSGLAGLSAAVRLVQKGVKVAVFEKRPFQGGGVSNTPMMTMAVRDDPAYKEKAFRIHMEYTHWNANAHVVRSWIEYSTQIPKFINEELGIPFLDSKMSPLESLGNSRGYGAGFDNAFHIGDYHFLKPIGQGHGAALICKKMADLVRENGGEIYFNMPINKLIKDHGKVVGAYAYDRKKDEKVKINSKAVVVAAGGFQDNPGMLLKYCGLRLTDKTAKDGGNVTFNHFNNSQIEGDGINAVWEIGGAQGGTTVNGHGMCPWPGLVGDNVGWLQFNKLRTMHEQPYLWVNQYGSRFINEEQSDNHMAMVTACFNQPDKYGYIVFDDDTRRHLEEDGVDAAYFIFTARKLENVRAQFESVIEKGNKHVFLCNTLDELCDQTGIDPAGLKETVERYNGYCDDKFDDEFFKKPDFLLPVKKPPFYCIRIMPGGYHAIGGIRIDGRCQVLDTVLRPIEGLYAGGDCTAAECYGNPPIGGLGFSSISFAQGLNMGDSVAEFVNQ